MKVDLTKYIEEHLFAFDNAYSEEADNQQIYQETVLPLVSETFKGAKTTCFAYGQTGSGKTFLIKHAAKRAAENDLRLIIGVPLVALAEQTFSDCTGYCY